MSDTTGARTPRRTTTKPHGSSLGAVGAGAAPRSHLKDNCTVLSALVPRELQGEKSTHRNENTVQQGDLARNHFKFHQSNSTKPRSLCGAICRIGVRFAATLPGEDKTTETKVRSIADALDNASTEQLCHYFVRSYLKDLAHNKLHGA